MQVLLIAFGLLGFELISYLPELLNVDSRIVTVPYRAIYLILCTFALLYFTWHKSVKVHINFLPVLVFWFFYFIRATFDTFFRIDQIKMAISDFWLFAFLLSFFPMLPLLAKINLKTIATTKIFVFCMAVFLNVMSVVYNYQSFSNPKLGRLGANLILNAITSGQIGVTLVVMSLTFFHSKKGWVTASLSALVVLGLANVVFAASRGPVMQLVIMLLLFLFFNLKRIGYKKFSVFLIFFACLGMYFSDYFAVYNNLVRRLGSTGQAGYDDLRYVLFTGAWEQFLSHPLLGDLIEGRAFGGYPHNIFLESLMAMGVFGGMVMTYIFIYSFNNSLVLMRFRSTDWIGCLLVMQLVAQFTSGSIYSSFAFWSLIALASTLKNNIALYH